MHVDPALSQLVLYAMLGYVGVMVGIGLFAHRRVHDLEDYVVAGRRLSLWLATPTLLATWYGAGTLLTAADEVKLRGLRGAVLDPLGAGLCLLIAGLFFAAPLWRLKLLTLPDLFARRLGARSEVAAALLMLPQYFGWIAAQFMALAGMLQIFFDLPLGAGLVLVCAVGVGYTLLGGMWAVTLTDALQIGLVVVGLSWMVGSVLGELGGGELAHGLDAVGRANAAARLDVLEPEAPHALLGFVAVLAAGALGNIPSQDLMQRVFAAQSAGVARAACVGAGLLYWGLGSLPVLLGLAAHALDVEGHTAVLPMLASHFLHPVGALIFVVTLLSAILSTIDSALLAPATVLGQNVMVKLPALALSRSPLLRTRLAVCAIALLSLFVAFLGESAYGLLESAYELGMVSLLVPTAVALFHRRASERAVLSCMAAGTLAWLAHLAAGASSFLGLRDVGLPVGLGCMALSLVAYGVALAGRATRPGKP